jgi:ketosteroid isomerase-like protein
MKKCLGIVALLSAFTCQVASSQQNINSLIDAEKSFASYAIEHNTRDAFLQFMDSANALVFDNGNAIGAYTTWHKAAANTNKLIWQPAFAGIAQSGDLGFTTGPWEFRHSLADSSLAAGNFTTIWHLNDKGEWKFLVDIGTEAGTVAWPVDSVKKWVGNATDNNDPRDALTIDRIFMQQYAALQNDAFKAVITNNTWFNIPGQKPITGNDIVAMLTQIPNNLSFAPIGGGVSGAGDLAYVYGTVRHEAKIANYLRVWHKSQGKYTLLLQVLQW